MSILFRNIVNRSCSMRNITRWSELRRSFASVSSADIKTVSSFDPLVDSKLSMLTPQQLADYDRDGFLVVPNFTTKAQLQVLQRAAETIVDDFDPQSVRSIFKTQSQDASTDDYFLDSGDSIRCFFEDGVFNEDGSLKVPKARSINKLGHALHEHDPVFRAYSNSFAHLNVCRSLGLRLPTLAQSMYIFKAPFVGGKVGCHQDSTFLYTTPESCVGLWVALDDATKANGCMWALPGSHKLGLKTRFKLRDNVTTRKTYFEPPMSEVVFTEEGGVPLEVPAGTLVLLHGALVHYSHANTSPTQRHAYTLHVVEGSPFAHWAKDNWMQRQKPMLRLDGRN